MDARLQGCRAFGELSGSAELTEDRAVVEPRLEQTAEVVPIPLLWRGARQGGVVEPRREQAAEEGGGTVVKGWQVWPNARVQLSHLLSFPLRGNDDFPPR